MAGPWIEIEVQDPGTCPVLSAGARLVCLGREILKEESNGICAIAVAATARAMEEISAASSGGAEPQPRFVSCPAPGCGARFIVRAIRPQETETDRRAEPSSPGRRGAVRRTGSTIRLRRLEEGTTGPFLSRLSPELAEEFVFSCDVERRAGGEVVISEGEMGRALYIVGEGEMEVVRSSRASDHELLLALLHKGQCFGEMSLLSGAPASATVRVRSEQAALLSLPKDSLEEMLGRIHSLHKEFSRIMAERLYRMNMMLEAETAHGLSGHLSMIGIGDLIQTLHASRRTGRLSVERDEEEIEVAFREGKVVSAVAREERGEEAFYEVLAWTRGDFSFEGGEHEEAPPEARIGRDTMSLLMEGMRRMDEVERGSR